MAASGCVEIEFPKNETMNQSADQAINSTLMQTTDPVIYERTVYVRIKGSAFEPLELRIVKGTTVKWENYDSDRHVINFRNISSQPFNMRESWSYNFNETGTFEYNCTIHPWMKHGRIEVK